MAALQHEENILSSKKTSSTSIATHLGLGVKQEPGTLHKRLLRMQKNPCYNKARRTDLYKDSNIRKARKTRPVESHLAEGLYLSLQTRLPLQGLGWELSCQKQPQTVTSGQQKLYKGHCKCSFQTRPSPSYL